MYFFRETKMDFIHIRGQKDDICTLFSVFLSTGGAPKRRWARENSRPLDGPELTQVTPYST